MELYMFRTVPVSIIRSYSLYTQQCYMSYRFVDSFRAGLGWNWVPSWSCCCSKAVTTRYRINTGDGHFLTSLIHADGMDLREWTTLRKINNANYEITKNVDPELNVIHSVHKGTLDRGWILLSVQNDNKLTTEFWSVFVIVITMMCY
jgi:hypothetical protein